MDKTQQKINVLVCDDLAKEGLEVLEKEPSFAVTVKTKLPIEELKKQIALADACVVRSSTQLTREIIEAGVKLKAIGRAGVGLDNVDLAAASKRGIVVINTPGGNTISAAEHAFCLLMAMARNIPRANESLKKGEWERKKFTGVELYQKTLGVVGLGRIGTEAAKRALAFGMRVIAYDPFLRAEKAREIGVELVDWETILKQSDFMTLHMPLTAENKHMIGENELAKMKKTVRIVNCARGGLIDETALAKALESGQIAAAAIDVFESEPPPKDLALFKIPNVIVTPHLGASTEEAQIAVSVEVVQSLVDFFKGKGTRNAVNIPHVDPEVLEQMQPFLRLSEKLGCLSGQLLDGQILQIDVVYSGEAASIENTTPVTVACLKGLLSHIVDENVNFVNATVLAKERGIKVTESKSLTAERYANELEIRIKTDKRASSVAGTVLTRDDIRLIMIDGFDVEAHIDGYLLLISNKDVPGIVGQIGTLLGNHAINIAAMTLGRDVPGGQAKTLIAIDGEVSAQLLAEIKTSRDILDAKLIKL